MDKLQMAHEMAMELVKIKPELAAWQIADRCFEYADAMQAEAEKRVNKERPEALCEVDWRVAPLSAHAWQMVEGHAVWINSHGSMGNAPSFGFTGSHIVERPHGF